MIRLVGIDPSTKTGFCALDEKGNVIVAKELTGIGKEDPKRLFHLVHEIKDHLKTGDIVAIEGFSFNSTGQGVGFQYGLGYAIRLMLYARKLTYTDVAPAQLKSYIGVSGWKGEKGSKTRLVGKEKKAAVAEAVRRRFGYENKSDNITDAYVLANMARENYFKELAQ